MKLVRTKARIVAFGDDDEGEVYEDVEVAFDGRILKVDQEWGPGEHAVYRGELDGDGHFRLTTLEGDRATLHRFPGDEYLEGWFSDSDGSEGYWRIGPIRGLFESGQRE